MYTTLPAWLDHLQSSGRYTFLRHEAMAACQLSPEATKKALQRLVAKKRVVRVKEYFYCIVPLEYQQAGAPPPEWFVADLAAAMKVPYYIGLLTAAALHGAAHHAPQEFQVVSDRAARPLRVGRARIRFFKRTHMNGTPTLEVKTPTGPMRVSSPEATAFDLVRFAHAAGGLDHAASVIGELAQRMSPERLKAEADRSGDAPTLQRLGFILDQVGAPALAEALAAWAKERKLRPVHLRPGERADGPPDARWRVVVGEPLEIEA